MDLPSLLSNCQNPDQAVRKHAEDALEQAGRQDMGQLMFALVSELVSEQQAEIIRQQAGMYVKLLLSAEDDAIKQAKQQQWNVLDVNLKGQIKGAVLQTLHSATSSAAQHTAALIIGKMGAIELPKNAWPEMLQTLLSNVTGQFPDGTKIASLEALGYMCDEWDREDMDQTQTNQILTCIVDGIRSDRPDTIRLAAANALLNSLDFTHSNFETQGERDMIMRVICEATQCPNSAVRKVAYECISNIAALYYDKLEAYMQVLFDLTIKTISQDEKEVALQALEFWSTLCDEELEIMEDAKYDVEPARRSMNYIPMALSHLIPLLLECLTKQEEDGDDDDWGVAEAGGTCLSLCAQVVGDDVVDLIVPFVTQNIQASSTPDSWRSREAAIMAFGAVLDGPSNQKLSPLVQSAMPVLISAMRDSHVLVKDTATWTIGKICELHVRSIPEAVVPQLVQHLIIALEDSARVCSRACYALHMFGEAFEPNRDDATNALSPYFTAVVQKLLGVMNREDWAEDNMRVQAMEALNVLVQNSAKDVVSYVLSMLDVVLSMLETSFNMQVLSTDDRERQQGLQSLLCGATAVICHKIKKDVIPHGDRIMTLLLRVFQNKHAIAQEEAFMAAGALADQLEGNFNKYMQAFHPVLIQGLSNYEEHQVCSVAVGVVGDLCRALEAAILSYSDDIVRCLLQNLQNASINRNVKPPVLACLGDIALAVGGNFEKYLDITMSMLLQAQNVCSVINNDGDDEFLEYINQLREGILEAYSGIIQGLNDGNKAGLLLPYVTGIVTFLEALAQDVDKEESVLRHAIGVVGDIATTIGPQAAPMLKGRLHLQRLVEEGLSSEPSTQGTAQWAMEILKKL